MNNKKTAWRTAGSVLLVFVGGLGLVLISFALGGFPFPTEPLPQLLWVELAFLAVLLGLPLFR